MLLSGFCHIVVLFFSIWSSRDTSAYSSSSSSSICFMVILSGRLVLVVGGGHDLDRLLFFDHR